MSPVNIRVSFHKNRLICILNAVGIPLYLYEYCTEYINIKVINSLVIVCNSEIIFAFCDEIINGYFRVEYVVYLRLSHLEEVSLWSTLYGLFEAGWSIFSLTIVEIWLLIIIIIIGARNNGQGGTFPLLESVV